MDSQIGSACGGDFNLQGLLSLLSLVHMVDDVWGAGGGVGGLVYSNQSRGLSSEFIVLGFLSPFVGATMGESWCVLFSPGVGLGAGG